MFVVFETTDVSGSVYDNVIANHGTGSSSVCFGRRNGDGNNMNVRVNENYGRFNQLEGFNWDELRTYIMYADFNQSTIPSGDVYAIGSKLYSIDGTPYSTGQSSFSVYATVTAPGGGPNEHLLMIGMASDDGGCMDPSYLKISYMSYSFEV